MDKSIRSQSFRVLDTETTGLDPRTDAIVELAWAIMRGDGTVLSSNSTLWGAKTPSAAVRQHLARDWDHLWPSESPARSWSSDTTTRRSAP
jgi:DNA polymerase III epsilon subunit-like protein